MFIHNFKYAFTSLFRNRMLIFWTFAFPIILGTFFNMAFSGIEDSEKLKVIDIAIVDNSEFQDDEMFKKSFETLGDEENKDRLFNIKYTDEETAKGLLNDEEITGYLVLEDGKPKVTVITNGINETIFKYVTEEVSQSIDIVGNIIGSEVQKEIGRGNYNIDYEKIYKNVIEMTMNQEAEIEDVSNSNLSYIMIEFYTLIAMTCLYGGILGMVAINQNLPNMSSNGKRVAVSPTPKGKVVLSSLLASYIVQLIGVALLFAYTVFVLKVDYGSNLPLIVLLACVRKFCWIVFGIDGWNSY